MDNQITQLKLNSESNIPLIAQLVEQLRFLIAGGELAPGTKLPPIRELAVQLGIHMHTVRIAYQRLEEDGLVSIQRRRGTIVQQFDAGALMEKHDAVPSFTFGVLLPGYNLVYEAMIRGITEATQRNHWLPLFSFTNDNPVLVDRVVNQMMVKQVDGFIVVATGMLGIFEDAARLADFPPIVFVDAPDMPGIRVLADTSGAAVLSTEHLIAHGHERIGMVTAPLDWPNVAECYQGYRRALARRGVAFDPNLVVEAEDFKPDSGYQAVLALFRQPEVPTALFAAADSLAVGALRALAELGLSVPEDVALTSFNDSSYAEMVSPQLTSSSFPAYDMGAAAAEMLHRAIRGEEIRENKVVLPSALVVRQSCGCK